MVLLPKNFPGLKGARWVKVDLNQLAKDEFVGQLDNRLNDPHYCDKWVKMVALKRNADFTYGGYMEDRSFLWRGHYHNPTCMRHLGVDYNVPAGTIVAVPQACKVVHVVTDTSYGGWGGCVFFELKRPYRGAPYFLYGHLAHSGLPKVGQWFAAGEAVARVGVPKENGVWFPHLHVQCFDQAWFGRYSPKLDDMDGYGPTGQLINRNCPDPEALMAGYFG